MGLAAITFSQMMVTVHSLHGWTAGPNLDEAAAGMRAAGVRDAIGDHPDEVGSFELSDRDLEIIASFVAAETGSP